MAVCALALSGALLLSCGASADQLAETPPVSQEPEAADGSTPSATTLAPSTTSELDEQVELTPTTSASSTSSPTSEPEESDSIATGVGYFEEIYVDHDRSTVPNGADSGGDSRTLRTLVFYPAAIEAEAPVAVENAPPLVAGPYPLVLFAHGFGSLPDRYFDLLSVIAADGYVVVAPEFPRTSAYSPNGPDPRDTRSQPGDLSFLVDTIAELDTDPLWSLSGLVDTNRIAATGHSNGAITVLGLSANSCCRDGRIDVVVAMAGPAAPFDGEYDFTVTPPMLLIHGTEDSAIVYEASAIVFNEISAAKGLLTLGGGDHFTWRSPGHEFFEDVSTTVLDFLAMVLDNDEDAADRLARPRSSPRARLAFAAEANSGLTVEVEMAEANRSASVEPSSGLVNGQTVVVSWKGYLPGQTVNVVQCSQGGIRSSDACDFTHAKILHPNPSGEGSVEMVIIAGPIGNGVCDTAVDDCVIAVNDSGILEPEATVRIPLSFADDS